MNKAGKINKVQPAAAIEGGEVLLECEGFTLGAGRDYSCLFDGVAAKLVGASAERILAIVPEEVEGAISVQLESDGERSEPRRLTVGRKLYEDLHLVANPTVDASDGSLIVTRSGSRGQQLPVTLFRLTMEGDLFEMTGDILNPSGTAFNRDGELFVTSRAEGAVYRVNKSDTVYPFASDMGVATGIAFDKRGQMFVGDRSGTIFRVSTVGDAEIFASLEPSVAAYHLAFGTDGKLYATAPSVASFDTVWRIDEFGEVEIYFRGLGRPQGFRYRRQSLHRRLPARTARNSKNLARPHRRTFCRRYERRRTLFHGERRNDYCYK